VSLKKKKSGKFKKKNLLPDTLVYACNPSTWEERQGDCEFLLATY
jgi:hypothetical protein